VNLDLDHVRNSVTWDAVFCASLPHCALNRARLARSTGSANCCRGTGSPKLQNWPRYEPLHRRRGRLVRDLMKADEKHAPTEATIIKSAL
jgi:hypothetical protein